MGRGLSPVGIAEQGRDARPVEVPRLEGLGREVEGPQLHKEAEHGTGPWPAVRPHDHWVGAGVSLALHEEVVLEQAVALGGPAGHEAREHPRGQRGGPPGQ